MSKTTKRLKPIQSMQKFNQGDTVNSITLAGATQLADVEIDKQGNVTITIKQDNKKADKTKLAELENRVAELETLLKPKPVVTEIEIEDEE